MDIRQLSVRYLLEQDRLLWCINSHAHEEIRLWLTRALMLRLWPLLNRVVLDHFAVSADARSDGFVDLNALEERSRSLLAQARKEEALAQADFSTPYKNDATQHPMGTEPLLVTEINLSPVSPNRLRLHLREQLEDPAHQRAFQVELGDDLVFAVMQLLGQALQLSQWLSPAAAPEPAPQRAAIDLAAFNDRPAFLN